MWNLEPIELTEEDVRALRTLQVDENGPGTILHDFEALLSFVRGRDLPVSKVNQEPSRTLLPQINALLASPIEVRFKRPQLKSYPHIEGLYLLLRATGLGQVGGTRTKPVLRVDQTLYDAWPALNPAEQYFALLETWLLRADPATVGDKGGAFNFPLGQLVAATNLLRSAGEKGFPLGKDRAGDYYWFYSPGRMGIALLELFGLATVDVRPPGEGEGWIVDRIYRTPLGGAVFALLYEALLSDFDKVLDLVDGSRSSPGALQPVFAPYVPQWQRVPALASWDFRPGRYIFRVSLSRGLWRQIAIDAGEPLDMLASAILNAYEFDHDHLYEFNYRSLSGAEESVHHPYMDEGPWTSEMRVGDVPLPVGQSMTYVFDFGDWWEFEVTLEQIETPGKARRGPALLDGHGDAPEQYPKWDEDEW
jgi:hypothetical protein